jgi:hypothetical protein
MLRIFSTHRLFGFLLIGLMITSCGGNTSSNTPSTGTSSKTSVTPITSNTTPKPQRNDYTSQCSTEACIIQQTSKWQQDLNQWLQGSTNGGSSSRLGRATAKPNILKNNLTSSLRKTKIRLISAPQNFYH